MIDYKYISIYVEQNGTLLGIPSGNSKKYDMADLDLLFVLKPTYYEGELEQFILKIFNECFSEASKDDEISSIEKYYNCKGYKKAVNNLKLIHISCLRDKGFSLTPTINSHKMGFTLIENKTIFVETNFKKGQMAKAFSNTLEATI